MAYTAIPSLILLLVAPMAMAADPAPHVARVQVTQITVHERIILRVPRMDRAARKALAPPRWKEKRGPHCVAAATLAGAMISEPGSVDLVVEGGQRLRAKLDGDCAALDFYRGFYFRPAADGQICADRDVIRARSGAACQIDVFRTLKPAH